MDVTLFREALVGLLRELVDGPPGEAAFIVNPGDRGILRSLAQVSATDASARPGGRSSVAAHVQHLRYGFELLNRWARREEPFADAKWAASWRLQAVTDDEWRGLIAALEREARAWMSALSTSGLGLDHGERRDEQRGASGVSPRRHSPAGPRRVGPSRARLTAHAASVHEASRRGYKSTGPPRSVSIFTSLYR